MWKIRHFIHTGVDLHIILFSQDDRSQRSLDLCWPAYYIILSRWPVTEILGSVLICILYYSVKMTDHRDPWICVDLHIILFCQDDRSQRPLNLCWSAYYIILSRWSVTETIESVLTCILYYSVKMTGHRDPWICVDLHIVLF